MHRAGSTAVFGCLCAVGRWPSRVCNFDIKYHPNRCRISKIRRLSQFRSLGSWLPRAFVDKRTRNRGRAWTRRRAKCWRFRLTVYSGSSSKATWLSPVRLVRGAARTQLAHVHCMCRPRLTEPVTSPTSKAREIELGYTPRGSFPLSLFFTSLHLHTSWRAQSSVCRPAGWVRSSGASARTPGSMRRSTPSASSAPARW